MANLIDKDTLVTEIEKAIDSPAPSHDQQCTWEDGYWCGLYTAEDIIDTLEVKEINNIWHEASETPKGAGDKEILVQFADSHASVLEIDDWEYLDHQTKWAYLKDLI